MYLLLLYELFSLVVLIVLQPHSLIVKTGVSVTDRDSPDAHIQRQHVSVCSS